MPMNVFPPMTATELKQDLIGTPAFLLLSAGNQPQSLVPKSAYAAMVKPAMRPTPATMPKKLGQVPPIQAAKSTFRS
jgi:hypothetical protein